MSYWAYEPDPDRDHDDEELTVECKRCGKSGLHWEEEDGCFVLCAPNGKVHVCDQKRLAKSVADLLEDLS